MVRELVCVLCGERFTHELNGSGRRPRFCKACKAKRRRQQSRNSRAKCGAKKRKLERAEAAKSAKVVKKCRRCGKVFVQTARPSRNKIDSAPDAYVLRSYCESCAWEMKRTAHLCDPRYVGVGGHGDFYEAGM